MRLVHAALAVGFGPSQPLLQPVSASDGSEAPISGSQQTQTGANRDGQCTLLTDSPHATNSRKVSLVLRKPCDVDCGSSSGQGAEGCDHERMAAGVERGTRSMALHLPAPECPIAWHIGGTCGMWMRRQQASSAAGSSVDAAETTAHTAATGVSEQRVMSHMAAQHLNLGRKVSHMLMRAAQLPPCAPFQLAAIMTGEEGGRGGGGLQLQVNCRQK